MSEQALHDMQVTDARAVTMDQHNASSNLQSAAPLGLDEAARRQLARDILGVAVRTRIADKFSPRTKLLLPADAQPWLCLPMNRDRKQADIVVNNWNGKSGTLVLGSESALQNLENTSRTWPYVQGLSGPVIGITVGTSNHVPWPYFGANELWAKYFGPATAKLLLSVATYTWLTGTPI